MKRLKLKEKPKRLNLSSPISNESIDITVLLDQYHLNTKINKNIPYYKWIKYKDHLPLDENTPILIYNPQYDALYDGLSFVALQHSLHSSYMEYENPPTHWMRIKKPEI